MFGDNGLPFSLHKRISGGQDLTRPKSIPSHLPRKLKMSVRWRSKSIIHHTFREWEIIPRTITRKRNSIKNFQKIEHEKIEFGEPTESKTKQRCQKKAE